jgi:hypothetical protein
MSCTCSTMVFGRPGPLGSLRGWGRKAIAPRQRLWLIVNSVGWEAYTSTNVAHLRQNISSAASMGLDTAHSGRKSVEIARQGADLLCLLSSFKNKWEEKILHSANLPLTQIAIQFGWVGVWLTWGKCCSGLHAPCLKCAHISDVFNSSPSTWPEKINHKGGACQDKDTCFQKRYRLSYSSNLCWPFLRRS